MSRIYHPSWLLVPRAWLTLGGPIQHQIRVNMLTRPMRFVHLTLNGVPALCLREDRPGARIIEALRERSGEENAEGL